MLSSHIDNVLNDTPLWLKELRLRKRNKQLQQHNNQSITSESPQIISSSFFGSSVSSSVTFGGASVQQPSPISRCHTVFSAATDGDDSNVCVALQYDEGQLKCVNGNNSGKMVQERPWIGHADHSIESNEKSDDSDSSEELKYGPGIVSKLKNRYLNLTLRETSSKNRPSILNLRKATSLEHILDDYNIHEEKHHNNKTEGLFQRHKYVRSKNAGNPHHIRNATKSDMKRARSVEIISDLDRDSLLGNLSDVNSKQRESLHEEIRVIEGSGDKTYNTTVDKQKTLQIEDNMIFSNNLNLRLNRPKKIPPVMDKKEKPQLDMVKEKKKLFEKAELRTKSPQSTGEVAAKVAGFKNIIDLTKASSKKPPIKQKPNIEKGINIDHPKLQMKRDILAEKQHQIASPTSPIRSPNSECKSEIKQDIPEILPIQPDVSKVSPDEINGFTNSSLSETPDLIVDSSHNFRTQQIECFLQAEKQYGIVEEKNRINLEKSKDFDFDKKTPADNQKKIEKHSIIYAFSSATRTKSHLPKINSNKIKSESELDSLGLTKSKLNLSPQKIGSGSENQQIPFPKESTTISCSEENINTPIKEELKDEIVNNIQPKGVKNKIVNKQTSNEQLFSSKPPIESPSPSKTKIEVSQSDPKNKNNISKSENKLTNKVIEKNIINKFNGVSSSIDRSEKSAVKTTNEVPILTRQRIVPKKEQQNSLVFDFTARKDIPDYVGNDGSIKPKERIRPKPGEGGIIILPGATLDESLVDDEEDLKNLLECPPSPCNVTFTNDNVLIEGRSSLKKLKKPKMTIRFIDTRPEIYEYPSENSLLDDSSHTTPTLNSGSMGHTVPSLSGSNLANYTPKSAPQIDEFQLGLKPSLQPSATVVDPSKQTDTVQDSVTQETPIQFSAGTNLDILF